MFRLAEAGIMLTEIAPGVDLQTDILDKMAFQPLVSEDLKVLDGRLFCNERMGLGICER